MADREQPSLVSELKAMAREAIKNIRETVVEQGWFGQKGGPGEPGTPLNPMYAEVTEDRGVLHGDGGNINMDGPQQSYEQMLQEASQRGQEQSRELER